MEMMGAAWRRINKNLKVRNRGEPWFVFLPRIFTIVRMRRLLKRNKVGNAELRQLRSAIRSGNLMRGKKVAQFEHAFSDLLGSRHAISSTSGTAAIHVALGMLDLNPGEEVIVPPITDIGSVVPILLQNLVPVFADVDPGTWNISADQIERVITARTRAVIAVHLFGNPCQMDSILDVARRHNLVVIEDCAQAHMATYKGRMVGTIGDIGCFSFQQSKVITTGDGGMTITNNSYYASRGSLFVDKGWDRSAKGARQYKFLGMNYRMTELQAAVGIEQLKKLESIVTQRNRKGVLLSKNLSGEPRC